jgi:hypothetical protein
LHAVRLPGAGRSGGAGPQPLADRSKRIIVTCHSITDNTDDLCRMAPDDGRFTVVVRGTREQPVNLPSWGPVRRWTAN